MLNMTTVKMTIEQDKNEGLKFAFGVSIIVFIQAYIAVLLAKYINNTAAFDWYITVFGIFIFFILSVYFLWQARAERTKRSKLKIKNSFRLGIILSSLNMFAIPFYCGVSSTLNMSGWINFEHIGLLLFVIGSAVGTYMLHYVYSKFAKKVSERARFLTKNLNYFLSILTAVVALIGLIKVL